MFDFKRKVCKEIFINIENNFGTQRRFTQEMKIEFILINMTEN